MKKLILFLVVVLMLTSNLSAQKKRKRSNPQREETMAPPESLRTPNRECQPIKEHAEVTISENGALVIGGKTVQKENLTAALQNYLCGVLSFERLIYIKAAAGTSFSQIAEVVRLGRRMQVDDYVLATYFDASGEKLKIVSEEPAPSAKKEKASPRALMAAIFADGRIELNGKAETSESLAKKLGQTFTDRQRKGVFMAGSREVEKTVFIYAAPTVKFADLLELIKIIEKTNAFPIGLDVDENYPKMIFVK